jgi:uncharacterized membrane protein
MKTRLGFSLMASLLTAAQILLILLRGDGMCFNEGCRIVDSLTTVPPLVFNLAGFLYFQSIFWGLLLDRKHPGWPFTTVRVLALAGMASEGVLVSFQYFISETFCSYCLVIGLFILLLNISFGPKQIASGVLIFAVVVLAFAGLQFKAPEASEDISLERGTYGLRPADRAGAELSLFFSSTCRHCENIIELLKTRKSCAVRFQPIDEIYGLDFPGLERAPVYSASVNRNFLKALGIEEIPVLVAKDAGGIRILKGEQPIREYLDLNCQAAPSPADSATSESSPVSGGFLPLQDDACSVSKDCDPLPVKARPGT